MIWIEEGVVVVVGLFFFACALGIGFKALDSDHGPTVLFGGVFGGALAAGVVIAAIVGGTHVWDDAHPPSRLPENCANVVVAHHTETRYVLVGKVVVPEQIDAPIMQVICAGPTPGPIPTEGP